MIANAHAAKHTLAVLLAVQKNGKDFSIRIIKLFCILSS